MIGNASERASRDCLVRYSKRIYEKGWVANHDGNLSARLGPSRFIATPTSFSKGDVDRESLVVVDAQGTKIAGRNNIFSEIALHLAAYRERDDISAVVHAHPPFATAMACAGAELPSPFIAEAVVSLGHRVPLVPFAPPGSDAFVTGLLEYVPHYDALLLEGHGVIAYGDSVEQAFLRLELVEHLARIATHAQAWGGTHPLPREVVDALLEKRRKAGLGPQARGLSLPAASIAHPQRREARQEHTPTPAAGKVLDSTDLARVIAEEIGAILSEH